MIYDIPRIVYQIRGLLSSPSWAGRNCQVEGDVVDGRANISIFARVLGHAGVQTTAGYGRRGSRAVTKALRSRHVPYRRRS